MPFPKDLKSFIFSKKQSNDVMMSEQNVVTDLFASWLWMFAQSNVSNGPLLLKEALSLVTVYVKACVCFTSSNYASL